MNKDLQILIKDNKALLVSRTIEKEVPLDAFITELISETPFSVPFLPSKNIGLISGGINSAFIIEQAPRIQPIIYKSDLRVSPLNLNIPLPWVYFGVVCQNSPIVLKSVSMVFSKNPIREEKDEVGFIPIPNIKPYGKTPYATVCLGEMQMEDGLVFHKCIDVLIGQIFSSPFNSDYTEEFGNKNTCPDVIMKKYQNICDLRRNKEKIGEDPIGKLLATKTSNIKETYLYAWQQTMEDMSFEKFIKDLDFKTKWTYDQMIKGLREKAII